jgi:hypothetical protein
MLTVFDLIQYADNPKLHVSIADVMSEVYIWISCSIFLVFAALRELPIAIHTDAANEQHYEVPTEFYQLVLGKHLKYRLYLWP